MAAFPPIVVTFTSGEKRRVEPGYGDCMRLEREMHASIRQIDWNELYPTMRLAWAVLRRTIPGTADDFDAWADTVADIDVEVDEPANPSEPTASTG